MTISKIYRKLTNALKRYIDKSNTGNTGCFAGFNIINTDPINYIIETNYFVPSNPCILYSEYPIIFKIIIYDENKFYIHVDISVYDITYHKVIKCTSSSNYIQILKDIIP